MQRRWANISLGVALALLLVSLVFSGQVWAPYLRTMALAGLAGGVADWYAVTALFRHPLGLKWLPHTSIIAANRDRIIGAISTLVETELLSESFLERRLSQIDWAGLFLRLVRTPATPEVTGVVRRIWTEMRKFVADERLAEAIKGFADRQAKALVLSDLLVRLIQWLIQSQNDRALFLFLSRHAVDTLNSVEFTEDMEARLKVLLDQYTRTTTQKIVLGLLESLGTVDYRVLSREIKEHLIQWLESDKAFEQFELLLVRMMLSLRDDQTLRERIERIKEDAAGRFPWQRVVEAGLKELDHYLLSDRLGSQLGSWQEALARQFEEHPEYGETLAQLSQEVVIGAIRRFHPVIGRLVRQNLEQMNEREWIDKLEWYVGRDLQWIRINGAIVGGLVGLILSLLMHL